MNAFINLYNFAFYLSYMGINPYYYIGKYILVLVQQTYMPSYNKKSKTGNYSLKVQKMVQFSIQESYDKLMIQKLKDLTVFNSRFMKDLTVLNLGPGRLIVNSKLERSQIINLKPPYLSRLTCRPTDLEEILLLFLNLIVIK